MTTVYADDYGFNAENATDALQKAIDDKSATKIVVENKGTPWIINEQIDLADNKEIVFEPGVVVQAQSGSFLDNKSSLLSAFNVDNVKLIGLGEGDNRPAIKMNGSEYVGSAANNQFNHAIDLLGVDRFEVNNLTLTGAGGDGIHIAGGTFGTPPVTDDILPYSQTGLIEGVISDGNRRQGMSIDSAKDLVVRNSVFKNTRGVALSAGIDLEPTWDFESLQNITIENVAFDNNAGGGILMPIGKLDEKSAPISVNVNNADFKNTVPGSAAIFVTRKYNYSPAGRDSSEAPYVGVADQKKPEAKIDGAIDFQNITISNTDAIAKISNPDDNPKNYIFIEDIPGDRSDPNDLQINFDGVKINDSTNTSVNTSPIYLVGLPGTNKPDTMGNLSLNDVAIEGNYNYPVVLAQLGNDDAIFKNISGNITVENKGDGAISDFDLEPAPQNFDLTVVSGTVADSPTGTSDLDSPSPNLEQATVTGTVADSLTGTIDLINSDFSDGLTGWVTWSNDTTTVERLQGDDWVKISPMGAGGIAQDISNKIEPGKEYRLSALAQLEALETYAAIGINYKDEQNQLQEFQNVPITSDTPQEFQLEFIPPENFASAEVFAYKQEGSALFVDDFSIVEQL